MQLGWGKGWLLAPPWQRAISTYCRTFCWYAACTLDDLLGHPVAEASWEGFVIEDLIAAAGPHAQFSYYRTADGSEIDLVIERGGQVAFAIEIKRSNAPKVEHGFFIGANDIGAACKIVITPSGDRYPIRDGAEVMPLLQAIEEVTGR